MPRLKYQLVVAQGYPAIDAAYHLDSKVNNLMEAGWEPSMPPGMLYAGHSEETSMFTAFQAMLWIPAHQDPVREEVTAGGHLEQDPVTPIIGEVQCLGRDTPAWMDAWAALRNQIGDIETWMYMTSKLNADGLSWEHSFKHRDTREYRRVTTLRRGN